MEECERPQRPDMSKSNFQNPISIKTFSPLTWYILLFQRINETHKKNGFCFFLNTKKYIKGNGVASLLHINSFSTDTWTSQMLKFLSWSNSDIVVAFSFILITHEPKSKDLLIAQLLKKCPPFNGTKSFFVMSKKPCQFLSPTRPT